MFKVNFLMGRIAQWFLAIASIGVGLYVIPKTVFVAGFFGREISSGEYFLLSSLSGIVILLGIILIIALIKSKPYTGELHSKAYYKYMLKNVLMTSLGLPGLLVFAYVFKFAGSGLVGPAKAYLDRGFYILGAIAIFLVLFSLVLIILIIPQIRKLEKGELRGESNV